VHWPNLIGNGVARVVVSLSEGELDKDALHETMAHPLEMGEELEPGSASRIAAPGQERCPRLEDEQTPGG